YAFLAFAALLCQQRGGQFCHGIGCNICPELPIKTAIPEIRNGRDLIDHATALYPVLASEREREIASRNKYHDRMFEAVIAAHLHRQRVTPPKPLN
ncbi:hypothetical protein, partial [Mucilaginibacter pineti]|uniref:hypothetical protein n=1 Tax=Mucilaginibacter pineti TaxID=1391627 RepID=UPI001967AF7F